MMRAETFIEWLQELTGPDIDVGAQVFSVEWTPDTVNRHGYVYLKVNYYEHDAGGQKFLRDGEIARDMRIVQMRSLP